MGDQEIRGYLRSKLERADNLVPQFQALSRVTCERLRAEVRFAASELKFVQTGMLLEYLNEALDSFHEILAALEDILENESANFETALVDLSTGRDSLMAGRHLLGHARADLLAIERSQQT